MIELFSNFNIMSFIEFDSVNLNNSRIKADESIYLLNETNVEEVWESVLSDYINLKKTTVVYNDASDIRYFLSLVTFNVCGIKQRKQFEEILLLNQCIFFN
jgi:hypothetical protein